MEFVLTRVRQRTDSLRTSPPSFKLQFQVAVAQAPFLTVSGHLVLVLELA